MKQILSILSLLFLVTFMHAQPRINMKYQIQRCLGVGGVPVQGCWVYTDALGQQYYITSQQAIDSLLDSGLRDTIIAYGGGVSGLTEDWVLYGKADGTIDQDFGFRRIGTDSVVIDSTLTINGVSGLTPTTVKVLRDGTLVHDNPLNGEGAWRVRIIKPLQQDQGNVDFIESISSATFDGPRMDNVYYAGWNLAPGGGAQIAGKTAIGLAIEDHFPQSATDHFAEFHIHFVDSAGVQHRPASYVLDKGVFGNWYGYNTVGAWWWSDPSNNDPFARIRRDGTTGAFFELFGSGDWQNKAFTVYADPSNNNVQLIPSGMSNPVLYETSFFQTSIQRLTLATLPSETANVFLGRAPGTNYVVGITGQQAADTIATYITFDLPEGFDSLITCANGDFGFIINGDTTCISVDSVWIDPPCVFGISMGDTISVCVPAGTPGLNVYNSNGALENTPGGNRLIDMDTAAIRFRRGITDRVVINDEGGSETMIIRGQAITENTLVLRGSNLETGRASIHFNGLTDGTHTRDYTLGLNPAGSGIFQMSRTNNLTVNPWLQYHGFLDSLVLLSKVQLDGIVYDEDGDQGGTGNILLAQADGTVNWVDTTGLFSGGGGSGDPGVWYETGAVPADAVTDEIYHTGDVHVGDATMALTGRLNATHTTGIGLSVQTSSGNVLRANSTNGGLALFATTESATTNGPVGGMLFQTSTSGTADVGFGTWIQFAAETSTGSLQNTNAIKSVWETATHASRRSNYIIQGVPTGSSTLQDILTLRGDGAATLHGYAGGTLDDSFTRLAGFDANGKIVSVDTTGLFSGGGGGANIYNTSDSIDAENRLVFVRASNDLEFELDSITGLGAEMQITHQNGDTLFRVAASSGNALIEIGKSVFDPESQPSSSVSAITLNGVMHSKPSASNTAHGLQINRPSGGDVFFGTFSTTTHGDSLVSINEGLVPGDMFMSFDTDLNRTRAHRDFMFGQGLRDKDGDLGSDGQVLKTTGTQVDWVNASGAGFSSLYTGDGTAPSDVDVTVTDNIDFDAGTLFIDGTANRVGINNGAPTVTLDIAGNTRIASAGTTQFAVWAGSPLGGMSLGADVNAATRTANVRKVGTITGPNYANNANIELFSLNSPDASNSAVSFGGRVGGSATAVTELNFVTQVNTTATGGIRAMRIDEGQRVGIGTILTTIPTNFYLMENNTDVVPMMEIEQLSTGDAGLQLSIPGDSYSIAIDNSDNDLLKFSYASTAGTAVAGTNDVMTVAPTGFASPATSITLGAAATTFAVTSNVMTITGDAGANTLATITAGISGQILTLIFVDALVSITDDASGSSNTVNLSAAFTSTAADVLSLVFDGTSWREVSRSIN